MKESQGGGDHIGGSTKERSPRKAREEEPPKKAKGERVHQKRPERRDHEGAREEGPPKKAKEEGPPKKAREEGPPRRGSWKEGPPKRKALLLSRRQDKDVRVKEYLFEKDIIVHSPEDAPGGWIFLGTRRATTIHELKAINALSIDSSKEVWKDFKSLGQSLRMSTQDEVDSLITLVDAFNSRSRNNFKHTLMANKDCKNNGKSSVCLASNESRLMGLFANRLPH
ncbi:hypothetical protein DFH29DRAFT_881700 [Suillus ampliporus]|nr:hypothetical protein DFH29DRAFT_881700 [Suillus ampliporus]